MPAAENKKKLLRAIGRYALLILVLVIRILPLSICLAFGRGLGRLMMRFQKKRYRVAMKNLNIAYGDSLPMAEKERIAKASFENFGMFAFEVIKFAYMPIKEAERRIQVDPESIAMVNDLLTHEKGILLVTGHLGNMEIGGRIVLKDGHELISIARESRDPGTTELMTNIRQRNGAKVITLRQSMKGVLTGLKRNALVAIVCDQNATDVFVPFFGHSTGTADGPAKISIKTGAPLVFFYCVRDGKGGYQAGAKGYIWPEPTGDLKADVERIMTVVNAKIEEVIREYPEQWLWFHDRWKSSPGVCEAETVL